MSEPNLDVLTEILLKGGGSQIPDELIPELFDALKALATGKEPNRSWDKKQNQRPFTLASAPAVSVPVSEESLKPKRGRPRKLK